MGDAVTPHALITDEGPKDWRFLLAGFDTLDLGLYVAWDDDWWEGIIKNLNYYQAEARMGKPAVWKDTEAGPCLILPRGKGANYKWHLQFPDMHIFIAPFDKPKNLPNVYVSPTAKSLWLRGVDQVVESVVNLIQEMHGQVCQVQVSRVDLAADFYIESGITLDFLRSHRVSRTRSTNHYENDGVLETFYLGRKSAPIQARIYDKLKKTLKSPESAFFLALWGGPVQAWRVEFQLRRALLRQMGINSIDDLKQQAGGLWIYLTEQWFSLRLPDNANSKRRTVHLWWHHVQRVADLFGPACAISRDALDIPKVPADWYVARIAGCMAPLAARLGISDLDEAIRYMLADVRAKLGEKDWDEEYARQRIRMQENPDSPGIGGSDVPF
ncbi:hypothetical protein [Algisphaera agarilytica]|uniref:Replication initiation factor n=1 Tax=Algisphaera agarilytica TaxID=1385975 RepID=A0A7X0HBL5_9BACT|nr:hypothetical protein [Algisphaera agarilytica]MBB6431380.1 hypothetical protein [Algisphaera agarilytica]